jgi:cell division septal protein FtsQ
MTERQQTVTPRGRRTTKKQAPAAARRRKRDVGRLLRWAAIAAAGCLAVALYLVVADSPVFAVNRVEVEGVKLLSEEKVQAIVRKAAGPRMLGVDLDAVRKALEAESYVKSASIIRVLPDTLRVRVEEREPAVVVRLRSGRFAWVDADGYLLADYTAPPGTELPPPMLGYEAEDGSERAAADNRERVSRYSEIQKALADGELWDRIDEVDLRYVGDERLQLTDNAIVVRVGDKEYRSRLQAALELLEAVRRGDVATLARYHVADVSRLLASADTINSIDMARSGGVSILCDAPRAGVQPAEAQPAASQPPAVEQQAAGTPDRGAPDRGTPDRATAQPAKKSEPAKIEADTSAAAAKSGVRPPAKSPTDSSHGDAVRDRKTADGTAGPRTAGPRPAGPRTAGPRTAERGKN